MKYLVMECHPGYAVLLDERGRFLKAANRNYQVGQTVLDPVLMESPKPRRSAPWLRQLSAIAACLVLVLGIGFVLEGLPCASVYLTINPEVRVDVNRFDRVVAVQGVNQDGRDLLAGYNCQRKELSIVMNDLVDLAIDRGYLHPGGKVNLTLDAADRWVSGHSRQLNQDLMQHLKGEVTLVIHTGSAPPTEPAPPAVIPVTQPTQPLAPVPSEQPVPDSGYTDYGSTEDSGTDHGDTDYGPNADGVTDYDDTDYGPNADGVTDYDDTDYGPNADGVTDYHHTDYGSGHHDSAGDHVTDYGSASDYDGDSSYGDDYDAPDSNYGNSDYDD